MNDSSFWIVLIFIWLVAFLVAILTITRLNSIGLICLVDVALTIGLVATLKYIQSWNPSEYQANLELLVVFIMIGMLVIATFACIALLQFGGVNLSSTPG